MTQQCTAWWWMKAPSLWGVLSSSSGEEKSQWPWRGWKEERENVRAPVSRVAGPAGGGSSWGTGNAFLPLDFAVGESLHTLPPPSPRLSSFLSPPFFSSGSAEKNSCTGYYLCCLFSAGFVCLYVKNRRCSNEIENHLTCAGSDPSARVASMTWSAVVVHDYKKVSTWIRRKVVWDTIQPFMSFN